MVGALLNTYFIFSLFFLSGAALRLLAGNLNPFSPESVGQETFSVQVIGAAIFAISLLLVAWRAPRLRINVELVLIIILMVLAFVSATWSGDPSLSIRRSAALVGTTIFGLALALMYEPDRLSRLLIWFSVAFIALNVVLAVTVPGYSFYHQGLYGVVFSGSFNQKNDVGHILGLSITTIAVAAGRRINRLFWITYLLAGAVLLLATRSVGSIISVVFALGVVQISGVLKLVRSPVYRISAYVLTLSLAAVTAIFLIEAAPLVLGEFGRDTTLSDRTAIWPLLLEAGRQTWLLGAGYGTVWGGAAGNIIKAVLYGSINNAHNGYLETWLNLGVVGLALVLILMLRSFNNLVKRQKNPDSELFARLGVGILMFLAAANLVSARLVNYDDISWSFLICVWYLSSILRLGVRREVRHRLTHGSRIEMLGNS